MAPSLVEMCTCRRAWYKRRLCCVPSPKRSATETDLAEHCFLLSLGIWRVFFFHFHTWKRKSRLTTTLLSLSSKMAAGSPSWSSPSPRRSWSRCWCLWTQRVEETRWVRVIAAAASASRAEAHYLCRRTFICTHQTEIMHLLNHWHSRKDISATEDKGWWTFQIRLCNNSLNQMLSNIKPRLQIICFILEQS